MVISTKLPFDKSEVGLRSRRSRSISLSVGHQRPDLSLLEAEWLVRASGVVLDGSPSLGQQPGYVDGSADFDRPVPPVASSVMPTLFQPMSSAPSENHYTETICPWYFL